MAQATYFREVDRIANEGELVKITTGLLVGEYREGEIHRVVNRKHNGLIVYTDGKWSDGSTLNLSSKDYVVLEPVAFDDANFRHSQNQIDNLSSNLRTFARQVSQNQHDIAALGEKIDSMEMRLDNTDAKVQHAKVGEDIYADLSERIAEVNDKAEMLIDDMVRLDERSNETKDRVEADDFVELDAVSDMDRKVEKGESVKLYDRTGNVYTDCVVTDVEPDGSFSIDAQPRQALIAELGEEAAYYQRLAKEFDTDTPFSAAMFDGKRQGLELAAKIAKGDDAE